MRQKRPVNTRTFDQQKRPVNKEKGTYYKAKETYYEAKRAYIIRQKRPTNQQRRPIIRQKRPTNKQRGRYLVVSALEKGACTCQADRLPCLEMLVRGICNHLQQRHLVWGLQKRPTNQQKRPIVRDLLISKGIRNHLQQRCLVWGLGFGVWGLGCKV